MSTVLSIVLQASIAATGANTYPQAYQRTTETGRPLVIRKIGAASDAAGRTKCLLFGAKRTAVVQLLTSLRHFRLI